MFGKRKLDNTHKRLIDAIARETKQSKDDVLYYIVEMGFMNLRMGTEENENITKGFDHLKQDEIYSGISKMIRMWWDEGQKEYEQKHNSDEKTNI